MIPHDGYGRPFSLSNIVAGGFWEGKALFFCAIQIVVRLGSRFLVVFKISGTMQDASLSL